MNIKIFINVDWFLLSHFRHYILTLIENGHCVTVYAADTGRGPEIATLGAQYVPIKLTRGRSTIGHELCAIYELFKLARQPECDLVECFTIKPSLIIGIFNLVFRLRSRIVLYVPGLGSFLNQVGIIGRVKRFFSVKLYGLISSTKNVSFIVENEADLTLLTIKAGVKEKQIHLVPGTGVNLCLFKPSEEFNVGPKITIITISRLLKDKGILILEEAAGVLHELYPGLTFIVVGDIDPDNPTSLTSKELDKLKNLKFWGRRKDINDIMRNADVLVHPTFHEGFSRVLMEASASGLAIVTTDVDGCRDAVINDFTGILVPPRDAEALALAIKKYVDDPGLRRRFGANARLHAEQNFSERKLSQKHMEVVTLS